VSDPSSDTRESRVRRLLDAHLDALWRFLRRLGVAPMDLEDALQEVAVILAERVDDLLPDRERSFLFGTAFRVAGEYRRRRARRHEVDADVLDQHHDPAPEPDALADRARARTLLDAVLAAMPIDLRTVFVLYEIEDLTMMEIADLLGVPLGTVASRLRRARDQYEARIEQIRAEPHGMGKRGSGR
jgi:RNA polymerase sigma-70 factor (ECF subfamily)